MNKSSGFLLFILGAAIGAVTTWKLVKAKYEAIAQEEIDSVKKAYSKNVPERNNPEIKAETKDKYSSIINSEGYMKNEDDISADKSNCISNVIYSAPYIITPDEFASNYEYDTIDITYFADGVLADENNEPLEDIENTIGNDAIKHFGEYEFDAVYVRNEQLKCDYEIIRDERNYFDIVKT